MQKYKSEDPGFVDKFLSSIYVDDVSSGTDNESDTYELYLKSKLRLAEAGFRLRKFVTNSSGLRERITTNERSSAPTVAQDVVSEEDQSYAKDSLGQKTVLKLEYINCLACNGTMKMMCFCSTLVKSINTWCNVSQPNEMLWA